MDRVQAWRDAFERVCALVEGLDTAELAARVPACPDSVSYTHLTLPTN